MGTPETAIPIDDSEKVAAILDGAETVLRQRNPSATSIAPSEILGIALYGMIAFKLSDQQDPAAELLKGVSWWRKRRVHWEIFYLLAAAVDITVFMSVSMESCSNIRKVLDAELRDQIGGARFRKLLRRRVAYALASQREERLAGQIGFQFTRFCGREPSMVTSIQAEVLFYGTFEIVMHFLAVARKLGRGVV
jgi:hypothetical protein